MEEEGDKWRSGPFLLVETAARLFSSWSRSHGSVGGLFSETNRTHGAVFGAHEIARVATFMLSTRAPDTEFFLHSPPGNNCDNLNFGNLESRKTSNDARKSISL